VPFDNNPAEQTIRMPKLDALITAAAGNPWIPATA
jgi:hypothetical protein